MCTRKCQIRVPSSRKSCSEKNVLTELSSQHAAYLIKDQYQTLHRSIYLILFHILILFHWFVIHFKSYYHTIPDTETNFNINQQLYIFITTFLKNSLAILVYSFKLGAPGWHSQASDSWVLVQVVISSQETESYVGFRT